MKISDKIVTNDNVRIASYDVRSFQRTYPDWLWWPKPVRKRVLRYAGAPEWVERVSNVTCTGWHDYCALANTLGVGDDSLLDPPGELAFGDDDSSFTTSDTAMNNEVGDRITITDRSTDGSDFIIDEYLSSTEQNGNTIKELGIFSQDGTMYQHSATSTDISKDNTKALVITITVPFGDSG